PARTGRVWKPGTGRPGFRPRPPANSPVCAVQATVSRATFDGVIAVRVEKRWDGSGEGRTGAWTGEPASNAPASSTHAVRNAARMRFSATRRADARRATA